MKSPSVAGKTIAPQVCHTQAGATGQAAAGGRAAKAGAAPAAAMKGVSIGHIDRLVQQMAQGVQASMLRAEQARVFVVEITARHAATVAGYAPARSTAASTQTSPGTRAAGSSATSSSGTGEWAFLDDPKLSMEDKLFKFMKLVMKKSDEELVKKMKEYQAIKASKAGGSSGSSGARSGGLFGVMKSLFPPLGALEKVIPALPDIVDKLAVQMGPQLLGALAIPLGGPLLAPLVQRAASQLLPAVLSAFDGAAGGASGSGSGSTGASGSSGASGEDERLQLLEIERMMQKTNQMFATVSNILKATHDAAMTAVNNIR